MTPHSHNWLSAASLVPQDHCSRCAAIGVYRRAIGHVRIGRQYPQLCRECALYVIWRRQKNSTMKSMGVAA